MASACEPLDKYLDALSYGGGRHFPAALHILKCGGCARCALRFACVRSDVYAVLPPASAALHAALLARQAQGSQQAAKSVAQSTTQPGSTPAPASTAADSTLPQSTGISAAATEIVGLPPPCNAADLSKTAIRDASTAPVAEGDLRAADTGVGSTVQPTTQQSNLTAASTAPPAAVDTPYPDASTLDPLPASESMDIDAPKASSSTAVDVTAASGETASPAVVVCPLCLGILQAPDATRALPLGTTAVALPDMDGMGGDWILLEDCTIPAMAVAAKIEGHETSDFCLALSVPAAVQMRQLAMGYALKAALPNDPAWQDPVAGAEGALDVKEALKRTITASIESAIGWKYSGNSAVRVSLMWVHPESNNSVEFLFGGKGDPKRYKRKRNERSMVNRAHFASIGRMASEGVLKMARNMSSAAFLQSAPDLRVPVASCAQVAVKVTRAAVHVGGRYRKLGRNISNSPWIPGKCVTSVQEELERVVLPGFRSDICKFMSAGREDADVRMLGGGRPYVLEIINARAAMPPQSYFDAAQIQLNADKCGVESEAMQSVTRAMVAELKQGEEHKQKSYLAICRLSQVPDPALLAALNAMTDILLQQQTPTRVAFRRAEMTRPRLVHTISCHMIEGSPQHYILKMRTQAGTYIKEFVHSDDGRTVPSLGSLLGCTAEILQLDVAELHMDFLK